MKKPAPNLREYVSKLVVENINTQRFARGLKPIAEIADFSQLFVTVLTDSEENTNGVEFTVVIEIDGAASPIGSDERYLVYIRETGAEAAAVSGQALTKALHEI